ncbi:hypothetical protein DXB73_10060 [Clostridium sp. OM05-6BH]|uniref:DpnII family type II restriction endonuclease n=1 Tax=unclassified Clostridium TaxID=2614128 RepID=UPI000E477E0F|nr:MULTISPECIES: DpnII family type II restriction endonuclease [unclassified Clostridium]RHV12586.1 hypothetical protein DXB78_10110 [Clostridium sp. OM05-9BH]RHV18156.1 hypothetical protein DXB73_10060 [Clostridium sp. OM05-6BH]
MNKPEKIMFSDFVDSMTSFYIDESFEDKMEHEQKIRQRETRKIYKRIEAISTYEGLKSYIAEEKDSLHNLTSLLGLSEENFKRVVSMIRRNHGQKFVSEWSINETRTKMLSDEFYMKEICGLLLGERDYSNDIPRFVLDQLLIDTKKLKAFSSPKVLPEMIKNSFKGTYSTQVGREVENLVEEMLQKHIGNRYVCRKKIFDRNIDFVIPNLQKPQILIEVSYMVTTGSGQSTKRETMINVAKEVINRNMHDNDKMIFINIIDGAGWIARQKDLERIYSASDYVLNLNTLSNLGAILDFYCK